jgi:predicted enzyme related to lactoylglutathione lyase
MRSPGSFCTSVLMTPDPDRAVRFYASLLGWTTKSVTPEHTFFQLDGKTVASIQSTATGHDAWIPHVCVDALEQAIEAATALGATLLDVTNVPGAARLATLRDREAGVFGLWQPDPHGGAEQTDSLGSIWWIEMVARDPFVARDFYGKLFGWTARDTSFEPFAVYTVFERAGNREAGLLPLQRGWESDPFWITIVSVDDCDATMNRASGLGGQMGFVHTVPKHGRLGSIFDPGGAFLALRGPIPAASTHPSATAGRFSDRT